MKIKLLLNVLKRNNYVFFDKENRLHLSLGSPIGFANHVSQSVKRAVLAGNVIDVNNVTGIEISDVVAANNEIVLKKMGYTRDIITVVDEHKEEVKSVEARQEEIQIKAETLNDEVAPVEEAPKVEKRKRSNKKKEDKIDEKVGE